MSLIQSSISRNRETAKILLGDVSEPKSFDSLAAGLNFYSMHSNQKKSKEWAIEWVEKNDETLASKLHSVNSSYFSNRGFVCRLLEKGLEIDQKDQDKLIPFFNNLVVEKSERIVDESVPTQAPMKTKLATAHSVNLAMQNLDAAIDAAIDGELIVYPYLGTNKAELLSVEKYITRTLQEFVDCKDGYPGRIIAVLKPLLKKTLAEVQTLLCKLDRSKTKKIIKEKNPAQMIKKVKYRLEDTELGLKSILLKSIVGKKQCWAFDTESRMLSLYVASAPEGFVFTGTTIQNLDLSKSVRKIVRKPLEFFSSIKKPITAADINTAYNEIRAKELPVRTGQTNEHIIFLTV